MYNKFFSHNLVLPCTCYSVFFIIPRPSTRLSPGTPFIKGAVFVLVLLLPHAISTVPLIRGKEFSMRKFRGFLTVGLTLRLYFSNVILRSLSDEESRLFELFYIRFLVPILETYQTPFVLRTYFNPPPFDTFVSGHPLYQGGCFCISTIASSCHFNRPPDKGERIFYEKIQGVFNRRVNPTVISSFIAMDS
jgi:hypothetical protein